MSVTSSANGMIGLPSTPFAGRRISGAASARVTLDDRPYLNFYGAGYLALTDVPEIREAVADAVKTGAPFSRQWVHACGAIDPYFGDLEIEGAAACGTETSVCLPSGALIGFAGLAALDGDFDLIFIDDSAHYNLTAAAAQSGVETFAFRHCDADSLQEGLRRRVRARERPLVLSDGVFPTTGRIPPLQAYEAVLKEYGGTIYLDDAHGFGVVGESGRGAAEFCGVDRTNNGVTLSKAYCAQGALIGCTQAEASRLRRAPLVRGSNSGSPISAIAAAASLRYVAEHPEIRERLRRRTDQCRSGLRSLGLDVWESPAPIVSFKLGSAEAMIRLQREMFFAGIVIHHSNYIGAGPEGIIRCAIFSDHSEADIDALIEFTRRSI